MVLHALPDPDRPVVKLMLTTAPQSYRTLK